MHFSLISVSAIMGLISSSVGAPTTQKNPLTSAPLPLSPDPSFNFQMLITLGNVPYAAADILAAAQVIVPNSFYSFNTTFYELAIGMVAAAEKASKLPSAITRDTYQAASAYFRSADFYLHGNWSDPLINFYWVGQTECFNKAIATLPVPGVRITLPSDGFDTIGIYYAVDNSTTKRPTMIMIQGYDAAQEDSYLQIGATALSRGYNVLTIEGPGQPTVRRNQGLGFIPDYEKVTTPAVDYLVNNRSSQTDMNKLTLVGISMGGYLAARSAAFEPRIKALVLNDGVWNVSASFTDTFPPSLMEIYYAGNRTEFDTIVDNAVVNNASAPSAVRWGVDQGLWSFNTQSAYDWIKQSAPYTLANITDKITVPTWIGNAVDDTDFPGQAVKVYKELSKTNKHVSLVNFTGPAAYHSEAGAFMTANLEIFSWLEGVFAKVV